MARYSQTALIDELERVIAVGGEDLRSAVFEYVTKTVRLTNKQAASIIRGGALNKFSEEFLVNLAHFLAPHMSEDMQNVTMAITPPNTVDTTAFKVRKARFIQEVYGDDPPYFVTTTLSHMLKSYESVHNKDICEATRKELIDTLSDTASPNKRTIKNACIVLRAYFSWCDQNGLPVPHKDDLLAAITKDIDFSRAIAGRLLSGPDEFAALLSRLPFSVDPRMVIVVILCWLGFSHKEISNLKENGVDLKAKTVWNPYFGVLEIPDVLIDPFRLYEARLDVEEYCRDADEPYIKRFDRSDSLKGKPVHINTIRQGISNINTEIQRIPNMNYNITSRGFTVAGAFWKLRQLENSGKVLTPSDFGYCLRSRAAQTRDKYQWRSLYKNFCDIYFE